MANGVRQGGILSPILFTVYIDELLQWLANIGVGCHWKGMFAGCLCYADDLALLAPSAHALRRMLKVCSDFAMERNLMFKARKTQLILFSSSQVHCGWCLHRILWVETKLLWLSLSSWSHVVMWPIRPDRHRDENVIGCANCLYLNFGMCSPAVKSSLSSDHSVGLFTVRHSGGWLETAINKFLRRIWNLPYLSHTA